MKEELSADNEKNKNCTSKTGTEVFNGCNNNKNQLFVYIFSLVLENVTILMLPKKTFVSIIYCGFLYFQNLNHMRVRG